MTMTKVSPVVTSSNDHHVGHIPVYVTPGAVISRNHPGSRMAGGSSVAANDDDNTTQQQQQQRPPLPPSPPPRPSWTRRVTTTTSTATCSHNGPSNGARLTSTSTTVSAISTPIFTPAVTPSSSGVIITAARATFAASAFKQSPPLVHLPRRSRAGESQVVTYVKPKPIPVAHASARRAAPQQQQQCTYVYRKYEKPNMSVASLVQAMNSRNGQNSSVPEQIKLMSRVREENGEAARRHGPNAIATTSAHVPLLPPTTEAPPPPVIKVEPTLMKNSSAKIDGGAGTSGSQMPFARFWTTRNSVLDVSPPEKEVGSYSKDVSKNDDDDKTKALDGEKEMHLTDGKEKDIVENEVRDATRRDDEDSTSCCMSCLMFTVDSCECNIM